MMNEDSKLRKCPFCGAAPKIDTYTFTHPYIGEESSIRCLAFGDCIVRPSVTASTREEAIAAWNTRIPTLTEDQKRGMVERVVTQLELGLALRPFQNFDKIRDIILSAINEVCAQPVLFLEERR